MKKTFSSFFLIICLTVTSFAQLTTPVVKDQGSKEAVRYFLPKKVFYVTVTFTIKDSKIFKTDEPTKQDPSVPVRHYTTITVEDPVKIEGKMFWNDAFDFDISDLGDRGKSFELKMAFDDQGNGSLSGLNGSQQPAAVDIIQGTVGIVTSVIGAVADAAFGVMGYGGTLVTGEKEQKEEQKVTIQKMLVVSGDTAKDKLEFQLSLNNFTYPIEDKVAKKTVTQKSMNLIGSNPKVVVEWSKQATSTVTYAENNPFKENSNGKKGLIYRIPDQYNVKATVTDNFFVKEFTAIDQIVYVPQTGSFNFLPVPMLKGNRTLEIAFDPTTGNLTKYNIKKESTLKASLAQVGKSIDDVSAEVKDLREQRANSKKDTSLEDEIARIELENKKLELLIRKKELETGNK